MIDLNALLGIDGTSRPRQLSVNPRVAYEPIKRRTIQPLPLVLPQPQGLDIQPEVVQPMQPLTMAAPMQTNMTAGGDPFARLAGKGTKRLLTMFAAKKGASPADAKAAWEVGGSL